MVQVKDFQPKKNLIPPEWGEKTSASNLADKVVILYEANLFREDGDKQLYVVRAEVEDEQKPVWFFTSSEWILRYKDDFPLRAKIVWQKSQKTKRKYLTLAPPR